MSLKINKDLNEIKLTETRTIKIKEKSLSGDWIERGSDGINTSLIEIEISEGITCINEGAFENCKSLKKVTLPASVKIIRSGAFVGCTALETVVTPDTLIHVEYWTDRAAKLTTYKLTPAHLATGRELTLLYEGDYDPHHWD